MHPITSWIQDPNNLAYARNAQTGQFRLVDDIANDPQEQWMSIPGYPYYEQSNKTGKWKYVGLKRSNYALIAKNPKYKKHEMTLDQFANRMAASAIMMNMYK